MRPIRLRVREIQTLTITHENVSKTCPKCKHTETEYISRTQKCDYCGKTEKYPRNSPQYTSDFYNVDIFPDSYTNNGTKTATFCSAEHMFKWIINYQKPFGFMTLPYVQGRGRKSEGIKGHLYVQDLKRLFKT